MKKLLALGLLFSSLFLLACEKQDPEVDAFAACINDSGAIFYGAFWCPHCQEQKDLFKGSVDLLPYQECAQGGKNADPELCKAEGIESYPTWRFADGSELGGVQSFETLSEYTSCPLPGEERSMMFDSSEE